MKLACLKSSSALAKEGYEILSQKYQFVNPDEAEAIVVLGGDGMLLHSIHEYRHLNLPFYGMNRGTVGFLMNSFETSNLENLVSEAKHEKLLPLRMRVVDTAGDEHEAIAFNEVSMIRYSGQSANLRVSVDSQVRIPKLICDGILVSTPAGSTAYNLSAHGPIVPLGANVLAMTPVSPFRPRRWKGALLPHASQILIENLDAKKRPVGVSADSFEVKNAVTVEIVEDPSSAVSVLFDASHSLEERIFSEQFANG